jgi:hypothetical protein
MIPLREGDVVLERRTADGRRFVLFTSTDVQPGWPLPWWGVTVDTGGDGHGLLVRLDEVSAPAGWTARQLLLVVRRRLADEAERQPAAATLAAVAAIDRVAARRWERGAPEPCAGHGVGFRAGADDTPYPWMVATCDAFDLPLCPDPACLGEGVTPEQLLIVVDQLLRDAAKALPHVRALWAGRRDVSAALNAEVRRLATIRTT